MIDELDDTLDDIEPVDGWIERRTNASPHGRLDAETVLEIYEEETGGSSDVYTVTRILATLYETTLQDEQLFFKANLPH